MNNTPRWFVISLLLALATPALAQKAGAKKVYCWNENGAKVCGDALPASAADKARTEISTRSGLAVGQVERALSDEERAAADARAWIERQNAAAAATAARRDTAMVESYINEAELLRAFSNRITLLDETVKASQLSVLGMRQSLLSLLQRASETELAGKPVAAPLLAEVGRQHQALRHQQQQLAQQRIDRSGIDAELAAALERYRALKQPRPDSNG